jgi:DNA repair exonuclease SbcCD nuclease subunit
MIIVGDIHIDKRFPFTNKKTHARWRKLQDDTLEYIRSSVGYNWIQVGDLFDNFMVSAEQYIRAQNLVVCHCSAILAGNHDRSNDTDKTSAVGLIACAKTEVTRVDDGRSNYILVPHQLTQDAFEQALVLAESYRVPEKTNVLLLHCNFSDRVGTITENYLPHARLQELCAVFDWVVSGHEHNGRPATKNGFLIGSILPMTFGEMTSKYVLDNDMEPALVWDADVHYKLMDYKTFLAEPINHDLQFIQVNGTANVSDTLLVAKKVAAWYSESESIIAIKPELLRVDTDAPEQERIAGTVNWVDYIHGQLTPEERELFVELVNAD